MAFDNVTVNMFVGLHRGVAGDHNVDRLGRLAGRERDGAGGGGVILAAVAVPFDVAYWTVTGLVEAFDSVTVNVMLEVPLLPSFWRRCRSRCWAEPGPEQGLPLCGGARVLATMFVIESWLSETPLSV